MGTEEEICGYEEQIRQIEAQMAEEPSDELEEARRDLVELVALLREEQGASSVSETSRDSCETTETTDDDQLLEADDLVGMRVMAPFPRAHMAVEFHPAIVLDVSPDDSGIPMAQVLYSTPLVPAMKPCSFFLTDSCRFDDKCKFSHGEYVPLSALKEYIPPDFSSLKEDSLVLAPVENGLWDVGRIAVLDKEEAAVKLLRSGKEVSAQNSSLIPIPGDVEVKEEEESPTVAEPNTSWAELKQERLGDTAVGDLGQWNGGGFGLRLMQKMGYQLGQGLGKNSDGIVHSVQAKVYPKGKGLDEKTTGKVAEKKPRKPKRRKVVDLSALSAALEVEIFTFINKKLGDKASDADEREERKRMKESTEKSLGAHGLNLEMDIKKLRSQERKLIEGIERNKRDAATASKLELRLAALRKDIQRLERSQTNVHSEMSDRRQKKKEIF